MQGNPTRSYLHQRALHCIAPDSICHPPCSHHAWTRVELLQVAAMVASHGCDEGGDPEYLFLFLFSAIIGPCPCLCRCTCRCPGIDTTSVHCHAMNIGQNIVRVGRCSWHLSGSDSGSLRTRIFIFSRRPMSDGCVVVRFLVLVLGPGPGWGTSKAYSSPVLCPVVLGDGGCSTMRCSQKSSRRMRLPVTRSRPARSESRF